jgi:SAM-dependent methyltransferase
MIPNGHAADDPRSRLAKARKIEALLDGNVAEQDLLDLGAGSGLLAEYFSLRGAKVTAADRSNVAYASDMPLTVITEEVLPFPDGSFDIVIFNHVIEHVGEWPRQQAILEEIARILKPGGRLYLAAPNKWALIEPHFRLPLLGTLPRGLADRLVRLLRGDPEYDCYPRTRAELVALLRSCFPTVQDRSHDAIAWVIDHEMRGLAKKLLGAIPAAVFRFAWPAYPTFIFVAEK